MHVPFSDLPNGAQLTHPDMPDHTLVKIAANAVSASCGIFCVTPGDLVYPLTKDTTMHKPITTPNAEATAITAVAIFSGLMEAGHKEVYDAWNGNDMGGGVELFALCAEYGRLSEEVLQELVATCKPFDFPGVYDYEVGETFGAHLREMIIAGTDPNDEEVADDLRAYFGRLMAVFFNHDITLEKRPQVLEIICRHTGFKPRVVAG